MPKYKSQIESKSKSERKIKTNRKKRKNVSKELPIGSWTPPRGRFHSTAKRRQSQESTRKKMEKNLICLLGCCMPFLFCFVWVEVYWFVSSVCLLVCLSVCLIFGVWNASRPTFSGVVPKKKKKNVEPTCLVCYVSPLMLDKPKQRISRSAI